VPRAAMDYVAGLLGMAADPPSTRCEIIFFFFTRCLNLRTVGRYCCRLHDDPVLAARLGPVVAECEKKAWQRHWPARRAACSR